MHVKLVQNVKLISYRNYIVIHSGCGVKSKQTYLFVHLQICFGLVTWAVDPETILGIVAL